MSHYDQVAEGFDEDWKFSIKYQEWMVENIIKFLQIEKKDILMDIGGGTGAFTKLIKDNSKVLKVTCVEPSLKMFNIANVIKSIDCLCEDALQFSKETQYKYNKVLFKEVVHHIKNRHRVWNNLYMNLPENGYMLIVTRPQKIKFPFFKQALNEFEKNQPSTDLLINELVNSGFTVSYFAESYIFKIKPEKWYAMLRNRFMSDLESFSDESIEEGIKELKREKLKILTIEDEIIYIVAKK